MLIGYRYSLYQDVSKLPYLLTPESVTPFQRLVTYFFMFMGLVPTMLIMTATSYFCHTIYPAGKVQFVCFDSIFSISDTNGFIVYILASILTLTTGWIVWNVLMDDAFSPKK